MTGERRTIYCCACAKPVQARLTSGAEIYPHRRDLASIPIWRCDACGNTVGCHHKTGNPTAPLGCIATPEIKERRRRLHAIIDPIWKSGRMHRKALYAEISKRIGREYHTAKTRSIEECDQVERIVHDILGASEP